MRWRRLQYLYDPLGRHIATYSATQGTWWHQIIRLGDRVLSYTGGSTLLHENRLQTSTVVTYANGNFASDQLLYPFGQEWQFYSPGQIYGTYYGNMFGEPDSPNLYKAEHRMYDEYMGRWLTPDPAGKSAIRLDDPQTWNAYAYVRNNPTSRTDPTGLYDFKNSCDKDNKRCNADFKAFQKEFKNSLKEIRQARNALEKGSEERARLDAVLKTYGKAGDNNGVIVTTGGLPGTAAAATVGSEVTFDVSKNPSATIMAINAGHEGTHVMDNLDPRSSTAPLPNFSVEYRGYETSAWVARGLGLSSLSAGGYTIFTSGQGFNDATTTNLIMDTYPLLNPGTSYLDPLPYHDPWDQQ